VPPIVELYLLFTRKALIALPFITYRTLCTLSRTSRTRKEDKKSGQHNHEKQVLGSSNFVVDDEYYYCMQVMGLPPQSSGAS
jgi:hypothetical protein